MKSAKLFIFLCLGLIAGIAQTANTNSNSKPLSAAEWQEDIDYFARQLVKKHMNAFHLMNKESFDQAITDLKKDLPGLTDNQVIIRLLGITASIGDGHTYVHLPANIKRYTVSVYWFGKDLYVIGATEAYKEALGKRLVKINGLSLNEVMQKLSVVISKNQNEQFIMFNSGIDITLPEVLYTLGIASDPEKAKFTFADEKGNEIEMELPSVDASSQKWVRVVKEEPLFRQRPTENFWYTYVEDINAVYVNFKTYDNLAENARNLFDFY